MNYYNLFRNTQGIEKKESNTKIHHKLN